MMKLPTIVVIVVAFVTLASSWRGISAITPTRLATDTTKVNLRDTLKIDEVSVTASPLTAEEKFRQKQEEYRIIYLHGNNSGIVEGILIFPPMLVLNINKIYNHFSASGKRARRFQRVIEDEFEEDKINEVWIPMTAQYAGLHGQHLDDFRRYYRPNYVDFMSMQQEDRLDYLIRSVKNFKDSAEYIRTYLELP